jgi:pheromone shutdown protein TraB
LYDHNSVVRIRGSHGHYYLLGTIHNTVESMKHIEEAVAAIQPDVMVLELEPLPHGMDHLDINSLQQSRLKSGNTFHWPRGAGGRG